MLSTTWTEGCGRTRRRLYAADLLARRLNLPGVENYVPAQDKCVETRPRALPTPATPRAGSLCLQPIGRKFRRQRFTTGRTSCRRAPPESTAAAAGRQEYFNLGREWRHAIWQARQAFRCRPQSDDRRRAASVAVRMGRVVESVVNHFVGEADPAVLTASSPVFSPHRRRANALRITYSRWALPGRCAC